MRAKPALWFIFITLALDVLGFGLVIPVLPGLVRQFKGGDTTAAAYTVGWLATIYGMMQFLFAPLLGALSDKLGRRPVILISLAGSVIDFVIQACAPTLGWFFVGRTLNGVSGANITAANAYIADITPPDKRAAGYGVVGAAFGLGFLLGPLAGGMLSAQWGLRAPFWGAAALTAANLLFGLFVLPESLARENRRSLDWTRTNPVGALEHLRRFPMVQGLALSYFLMMLSQFGVHSVWVLYTQHRYAWNPTEVAVSLAIVGLMTAVVQMGLARWLVPKLGERRALLFGMSMSVLNLVSYGLATKGWMLYAILAVGSVSAVSGPSLNSLISKKTPANEQGSVQGVMTSLSSLATCIAPGLSSILFGYFIGEHAPVYLPGAPFFFSALLMATALALTARFLRTRGETTVAAVGGCADTRANG
jgi:MFS transporter, DHA1 family, tetracycline resistance protein